MDKVILYSTINIFCVFTLFFCIKKKNIHITIKIFQKKRN